MSSKPIAIANSLKNERAPQFLSTSPASSVASSSGLYIPLHKRRTSMFGTDESCSSSSYSSISSRPSSRAESHVESESELAPHVYSREMLLALAKSPLAVMTKEVKDGLRETVPEIVMSRRHRKAMEYRARTQQQKPSLQKESNASTEEPQRQHHPQEPRNQGLLLRQDSPIVPAQHHQSEQALRQVQLNQPQPQKRAARACDNTQPRANHQQKHKIIGTSTRVQAAADENWNWRRRAGPPSISISAA